MTVWATFCCVAGFIINIVLYCLAVILSWAFARGLPQQVHHSPFPNAGAIIVTLPIIAIIIGLGIAWLCSTTKTECGEDFGLNCGTCLWAAAFFCGGLCSLVGGILLLVAAAHPPPPNEFDPKGYSAFAAIAGITAVLAGFAHSCGLCGCVIMKKFDGKVSTRRHILAHSEM